MSVQRIECLIHGGCSRRCAQLLGLGIGRVGRVMLSLEEGPMSPLSGPKTAERIREDGLLRSDIAGYGRV